jgi:hypothetical protein
MTSPTRTTAVVLILLSAALAAQVKRPAVQSLAALPRYVGTYPCTNGVIVSPVMQEALKRALGPDFAAYQKHVALASCGPVEVEGQYYVIDESQMGVGGHTSLIFVKLPEETVHVFWLKSLLAERNCAIYGPRPVPKEVMASILRRMNEGWGRVARFTARGDKVDIVIKK